MRRRNWVIAAAVVAVAILIWALRGERPAPSVPMAAPPVAASPPPPPPPAAAPEGKVAVIEGEVDFTGTQPSPGKLHREADPYCARREMTDPAVLVNDGKLANVWVHVTKGAPDAPTPAGPVEMNQKDCMYVPRVAAAVVGQKTIARNGDPILHNVHA